jgi:hypothetical protein
MSFYIAGTNITKNGNQKLVNSHINNSVHRRVEGKSPSTALNIYTTKSPSLNTNIADVYVRNPSCWINGIKNISCISPAQMSGGLAPNLRRGTLITPKHMIFAEHYYIGIPPQGVPFIFVDENNNVVRRKVMQIIPLTIELCSPEPNPDLAIGVLDQPVPSNIKHAKVLPLNFNNYISTTSDIHYFYLSDGLLCLAIDQEDKAQIKAVTRYATINQQLGLIYFGEKDITVNPYTNDWEEYIIAGDSANPIFLIIDNELVMISLWSGPTFGPFLPRNMTCINNVINTLSPNEGYSLDQIDLSSIYNRISIRIAKK